MHSARTAAVANNRFLVIFPSLVKSDSRLACRPPLFDS